MGKDDFPLVVSTSISDDDLQADAVMQVTNAIERFNDEAGWTVFRPALYSASVDFSIPDVVINWNVPYDKYTGKRHGGVSHTKVLGNLKATVNMRAITYPYINAVLLHELGHVVGLPHAPAEDRINIMSDGLPNVHGMSMFLAIGFRRLSSDDIALLENTYQ